MSLNFNVLFDANFEFRMAVIIIIMTGSPHYNRSR